MIIIIATFAQALSGQASAISIIGVLVVWRFIMGVGIGGDYPLSAVISSEFASTKIRGRMMTAVFASQGWGNFRTSHDRTSSWSCDPDLLYFLQSLLSSVLSSLLPTSRLSSRMTLPTSSPSTTCGVSSSASDVSRLASPSTSV
jgi:hypothetical protein